MTSNLEGLFKSEFVRYENLYMTRDMPFEKIKESNNLLELLVNENETVKFRIIICSISSFSKFEILYNVLINEIDLTQNNYLLFKCAVLFGNIKIIEFLLQDGFNSTDCLDFALKAICNKNATIKKLRNVYCKIIFTQHNAWIFL